MYLPKLYKDIAKATWWLTCGVMACTMSVGLAATLIHFNNWSIWLWFVMATAMCSGIHTIVITMKKAKKGEL